MVDATSSLIRLIEALDARDVSARELLELHLDRIERLDGPINSVVTIEPARAHAEATAVDQARAAGHSVGPLAGVPVTVKDAIATAGIRSTGGAVELRDHVPDDDATVVAGIRDAGAVVFAKTNVPRWSGDYQTYNEMFGTTNNPWDLDRTPGGSSGGPAAAVAMGFTGFEIGTDIGGSIRVPSSFCGVYGHKPSFGIIPTVRLPRQRDLASQRRRRQRLRPHRPLRRRPRTVARPPRRRRTRTMPSRGDSIFRPHVRANSVTSGWRRGSTTSSLPSIRRWLP
jgi:Asp-tRNA(Asn)/Glu-tRNA(Gln) amidotransferase A subunit family amidase